MSKEMNGARMMHDASWLTADGADVMLSAPLESVTMRWPVPSERRRGPADEIDTLPAESIFMRGVPEESCRLQHRIGLCMH